MIHYRCSDNVWTVSENAAGDNAWE